jgi:hypothetical protein
MKTRWFRAPTAAVLGMEPEELLSELKDGKTRGEVAEEQADAIYERVEENIDRIVDAPAAPLGRLWRGMR